MVSYRHSPFSSLASLFVVALSRAASAFAVVIYALTEPIRYAFDVAFPATAAVTAERVGLANDLIRREPDRHRAKAFVSRMLQRNSNPHRSAPLAAGGLASAGLSFAC
ncbi:hypothetical protein [Phenylobacterium ferrooxidans]|uniref:Secreted protein n=1 Tax=Phenylobacterium ferrooxidans TaxID=2982689 RepID=A0ABW6CMY9_9CAUL